MSTIKGWSGRLPVQEHGGGGRNAVFGAFLLPNPPLCEASPGWTAKKAKTYQHKNPLKHNSSPWKWTLVAQWESWKQGARLSFHLSLVKESFRVIFNAMWWLLFINSAVKTSFSPQSAARLVQKGRQETAVPCVVAFWGLVWGFFVLGALGLGLK